MNTPAELGAMIEEALNDSDPSELFSVINSFAPEQWATIATALQSFKGEFSS